MSIASKHHGMWECLVGVRHRGCPISDTSATLSDLAIQNVSKANVPGSFGRRLLYLRGGQADVEQFEDVCGGHDAVTDIRLVSEGEDEEAYYAVEIDYDDSNPSVLSLINSRGMFHHGSIGVKRGIEHWLVYSEQKSAIKELIDTIQSHDNTANVHRMVDLSELGHVGNIEHGILLSQLTERQRTTFQTALEMGYYDEDSETIVSDIADELGRHETTAWEHLNKAENTILTNVGEQLFSERPVVSRASEATR